MNIFKLIKLFQKAKGRSPSPGELADLKKQAEAMQPSNVVPFQYKRNFGDEVDELIKKGDVTIGTAPKTTKKKAPVDPKFEAAVKAQDERSESFSAFKKRMEARNKEAAFNIAFKRYKDIDKKPLEMDEVISIYTNLGKYPKGRSIIIDDIMDIRRGYMLPAIGNRSREMIVNKLDDIVKYKKQPNPFKKSTEEVEGQLEMDFTDWDPKGMAGGGLAYMLGEQPRVGMMYGGDPGFAFEYGGSWADWNDNHKHMMPVTEYISTKLPKDRLPFRNDRQGYEKGGLSAAMKEYLDKYKEEYDKAFKNILIFPDQKIPDALVDELITAREKLMEYNYLSDEERQYYNDILDAADKTLDKLQNDPTFKIKRQDIADGGRAAFKDGGFDKGRRNFMKMAAGLASIPFIGKFFKVAKPAAKAVEAVKASDAVGMPAWFPKLVDKVLKEGKDLGGTVERNIVKEVELPSGTKVVVDHDLTTGNTVVDVGRDKHGFSSGRYGQPARLELTKGEWIDTHGFYGYESAAKGKKGVKTKDEFFVEEAEFTGGHPENIKYEESAFEKYGDHASDFSEVEYYATGKNVDKFNLKGTKKAQADEFAQGRAEIEAEQIDEFAKGGLARMLGE